MTAATLSIRPQEARRAMPDNVQINATLHLEVRSRGTRPGQVRREQRVYTHTQLVDPNDPEPCRVTMQRQVQHAGGLSVSTWTWTPETSDLDARTSTFRESVKASDKLLEYLEHWGWTRRPDLEVQE
ncbi:hypothetical protein IHN63_02035 [Deinococcus sp. 6YEL10]|uniref:hypothetical protein n=1 Tax=Deinococcus sp. 6YEL10 TaxID=2745870 RepID=UPI001E303859|nr:hypothetical protein [Deinococcus sp. 6YEL10]MCD0160079.1 hypothetical protein [Deinococcus sp. 6YEL10]